MSIKAILLKLLALKCEEYEYGRYKVWSETNAGEFYLIDLLEYKCSGRCDCPDFRTRIYPVLEGTKILTPAEQEAFLPICKHIARAKLAHADKLSAAMKKQESSNIKHHATRLHP